MLNFTKTDEELAYVIAKEIAHNALGHAAQQRSVATAGGVIDNLLRMQPDSAALAGTAGIRPYPQALDIEADNVALYMLARAGYNIDNASSFWGRLAEQYPANVHNAYNALHPFVSQRLSAIDQAVPAIKAKQESKIELMP
jgi:predicted Zn-dependent protease